MIALGFGSTEVDFEEKECGWLLQQLAQEFSADPKIPYFLEEIVARVREGLLARCQELRSAADDYQTAPEYPDRYSSYWFSLIHDPSNVVCVFRFFHVNRRHAMSPDGWGAWQHKVVYHIDLESVVDNG